jgi:thymidylate synthase
MEIVRYKPYEARQPDHQYHNFLKEIRRYGRRVEPIHTQIQKTAELNEDSVAFKITGGEITYDLSNGFPLLTERDLSIYWKGITGELTGFLNGARTHEELSRFGCTFWKRWTPGRKTQIFGQPEGNLGPGSYGHSWTSWPKAGDSVSEMATILFWRFLGETLGVPVATVRYRINQIASIIRQIQEMPFLRTHAVMVMHPEFYLSSSLDRRRTVVAPCHGEFLIQVYPQDGDMEIVHRQRSADFPVGTQFNIAQYALLGLMIAQVTGYTMTKVIHQYVDRHMYKGQSGAVDLMLSRAPRRFPTVLLDPDVKDIFAFRHDSFTIQDYDPHPAIERIWTPE